MTREEYILSHIGSFNTEIVGIQYYKGTVSPGDEVFFERAPYNPYDNNAIEAHNKNNELTGHLPREISLFMAPLIDDGLIFLKGNVTDGGDKWKKPLRLDVLATLKGKNLFSRKNEPEFEQIIHNQVAEIYERINNYRSSLIFRLAEMYKSKKIEMLPETLLLLHILQGKAEEKLHNEREVSQRIITGFLENTGTGDPEKYKNLTIIPLFNNMLLESQVTIISSFSTDIKYSRLPDSNKNEYRLRVHNPADRAVVIIGGECPPLSDQGIMIRRTVIIPPGDEADIMFYRLGWAKEKTDITVKKQRMLATPEIRLIPTFPADNNSGDEEEEQRIILDEIDSLCSCYEAEREIPYRRLWEISLSSHPENKKLPGIRDGAAGYAFFCGYTLVSCDIFSHHTIASSIYPYLLRSVFVQCASDIETPEPFFNEEQYDFIKKLREILHDKTAKNIKFADSLTSISFSGDKSSVNAVLYNGEPVHITLRSNEIEFF